MIPDKDDLILYKEDKKKASKVFKVTEKTIINWFKKYDLYEPKVNYGCGKLNMEKANEIRELRKKGMKIKDLAKKYKVTIATISRIINNKTYNEEKNTAIINVVYKVENN
jgi:transposase